MASGMWSTGTPRTDKSVWVQRQCPLNVDNRQVEPMDWEDSHTPDTSDTRQPSQSLQDTHRHGHKRRLDVTTPWKRAHQNTGLSDTQLHPYVKRGRPSNSGQPVLRASCYSEHLDTAGT